MDRFRVEVISQTPNPQQVIYAALHQDYTENFVFDDRDSWPSEAECGEIIVKRLLAGDRGHYGPLEHPQIIFNCGYFPHSVMQQARTHRVGVSFDVQCLAADTAITFVDCEGSAGKKNLSKTIGELYDLWNNGEKAIRSRSIRGRNGEPPGEYRRDCKQRIRKMRLRVLNEQTGLFEIGHIKDVMCSGIQPVYKVTLEDGKTLECTTNHRLFTANGWQTMKDAVGLITNADGNVVAIAKNSYVMCNGLAVTDDLYTDKSWLEAQECYEYSASKSFMQICRGSAPVPTPDRSGQPQGDCPYNNYTNDLVSLYIHQNNLELEFAKAYSPILDPQNWQVKPKQKGRKLRSHPVQVKSVEYVGEQMTYDLEVDGEWHNFVANGLVVHNSLRYTGNQFLDVAIGKKDIEDIFYLRPVDYYTDREGKKYYYSPEQRQQDLEWCLEAAKRYKIDFDGGMSEEHARGKLPFDYRQHFVVSFNLRSFLHFCDLRNKKNAQLEIQKLCEMMWPHFENWAPDIAKWYTNTRLGKARLAP